jgi:hypothetical protein
VQKEEENIRKKQKLGLYSQNEALSERKRLSRKYQNVDEQIDSVLFPKAEKRLQNLLRMRNDIGRAKIRENLQEYLEEMYSDAISVKQFREKLQTVIGNKIHEYRNEIEERDRQIRVLSTVTVTMTGLSALIAYIQNPYALTAVIPSVATTLERVYARSRIKEKNPLAWLNNRFDRRFM